MYLCFLLIITLAVDRPTMAQEIIRRGKCVQTIQERSFDTCLGIPVHLVEEHDCEIHNIHNSFHGLHEDNPNVEYRSCKILCELSPCNQTGTIITSYSGGKRRLECRCKIYHYIDGHLQCREIFEFKNDLTDRCTYTHNHRTEYSCETPGTEAQRVCKMRIKDVQGPGIWVEVCNYGNDDFIPDARQIEFQGFTDSTIQLQLCSYVCDLPRCTGNNNAVAVSETAEDSWMAHCRCKEYFIAPDNQIKCRIDYTDDYDLTDPCYYPPSPVYTGQCSTGMGYSQVKVCKICTWTINKCLRLTPDCPGGKDKEIVFFHKGEKMTLQLCESKHRLNQCQGSGHIAVYRFENQWKIRCLCQDYSITNDSHIQCKNS